MKTLNDIAVFEIPKAPKPETFVYQRLLDFHELQMARNGLELVSYIKRDMARHLAHHIEENCQMFTPEHMDRLIHGLPIRIELTVNDRGTYENYIPSAIQKGREQGIKQIKSVMPYGYELDAYWE